MIAVAEGQYSRHRTRDHLELAGQAPRAYPLRYSTWHEIVNDYVGDIPFTVTFCPLCNSAIVFDRRVQGQVLDFGVTCSYAIPIWLCMTAKHSHGGNKP